MFMHGYALLLIERQQILMVKFIGNMPVGKLHQSAYVSPADISIFFSSGPSTAEPPSRAIVNKGLLTTRNVKPEETQARYSSVISGYHLRADWQTA